MAHVKRLGAVVLLLAAVGGKAAAQHDHAHTGVPPERLGSVHFETSCSPAAQPVFDRAMALLHSFWYAAARQAFDEAARLDPACAIAHWGVAMSVWGNPFGGTRTDKTIQEGLAAVERARAAGARTKRERDFIAAVEELYRDAASRSLRERQLAYEQAMEQLARQHAEDEEAQIFYALALVAAADPADKSYAKQLKAGKILEPFFARHPDHPGVAHYIIHAYDHPPLAEKALEAAKRYATIAPDAPHALHMPSHTFTRVGYWKESIETNAASADAARKANSPGEVLHAMDYQVYAYLQLGRDAEAARLLPEARVVGTSVDQQSGYGFAGMFGLAAMPARTALERGAWAEAASLAVDDSRFPQTEAITRFARALGAARSGNPAAARQEVTRLQELERTLHHGDNHYWADQVGIQREVAEAWLLHVEGRTAEAIERLRAAADREDATEKHAVTPGPLAPARELLGEMLLEANQPAAAREAFEATMKKEPNRFRTLYGAARAAELAGDAAGARQHFSALVTLAGESERQEVRTARTFLNQTAL
jgi:hypothetical protein